MSDCTYVTEPKLTVVDGRCISIYEDEKVEQPKENLNLLPLKIKYENLGSVAIRLQGLDGLLLYSWE